MKKEQIVYICVVILILVLACWIAKKYTDTVKTEPEQTVTEAPTFAPTEEPIGTSQTETPSPEPTWTETPIPETPVPAWTETPEPIDRTKVMYVISQDGLRLRELPDLDANIIDTLPYGSEVMLLNEADGWGFISFNGIEGYVSMDFLSEPKPGKPETGEPVDSANGENTDELIIAYENPESVKTTAGLGKKVAIDAGHQARGNNELEPIGPGASESKAKVASGTSGVSTKVPEYQLTLEVSLKLRDELRNRGYEVYMVRESNDVDISNRERAVRSADAGADILVRIHANGSENQNANGILTISPGANNPYISHLYQSSYRLAGCISEEMVKATGANSQGIAQMNNMSGINWSTIPVTIVEMGFMTNPAEDERMQRQDYQYQLVNGIANGIDMFFVK